jgi:hypothetical protein
MNFLCFFKNLSGVSRRLHYKQIYLRPFLDAKLILSFEGKYTEMLGIS